MPRGLYIILGVALLSAACRPDRATGVSLSSESSLTEEEKGHVLARVGERLITLRDFEARLSEQSSFVRARYSSVARKRELLNGLVELELLLEEARAAGLEADPAVKRAHARAMVRRLLREESAARASMADISEADISAYYQAHLARFHRPQQVEVAQIVATSEADAARIAAQGEELLAVLPWMRREVFDLLTVALRKDGAFGGDLGFLTITGGGANDAPTVVAEAAFKLKDEGAISAPIQSPKGWHVIQRRQLHLARQRPLSEVKAIIRSALLRARRRGEMDRFVADLRGQAQIWIDEGALAPQAKE